MILQLVAVGGTYQYWYVLVVVLVVDGEAR